MDFLDEKTAKIFYGPKVFINVEILEPNLQIFCFGHCKYTKYIKAGPTCGLKNKMEWWVGGYNENKEKIWDSVVYTLYIKDIDEYNSL